ncbi:helix-turn-helix domain-containing protein [Anaerotignum sp.]|uniref:helix-turn-helix domain-containing protein n=1 Tax=Anaerotignum sp. TaxID=2039241 RepID=UPI0028A8DF77|nr:helix-turn-helix domain-containing protein [Anaerotignum sp.]
MAFSYNKLWKMLIDKNMNKADLRMLVGLSPNTMSRLSKGESVKMDIVGRICEKLECNICDIVDYIPQKDRNK